MKAFAIFCAAALLCGLLPALIGCERSGELTRELAPAAPAQSSVPDEDAAQSSQPVSPSSVPEDPSADLAAAFAEKAETLGTNVTGVTPAGTATVEGETWYLFDVKADVDTTYLTSPDLTRIFSPGDPARDTDLFCNAANAYYPVEDAGATPVEDEWRNRMYGIVMADYGSEETMMGGNLIVVDGVFCREVGVAVGILGEMGETYGATYAMTLDEKTLYRLDDEAHVFRQVDIP